MSTWEDDLQKMERSEVMISYKGIPLSVDFEYNENNGDGDVLGVRVQDRGVDLTVLLSDEALNLILAEAITKL